MTRLTGTMVVVLAACAALAVACEHRGSIGDDLGVRLIAPVNGGGAPLVAGTTDGRPVFRWTATPAASRFELQVDDSCSSTSECAFASPEVDEKSVSTATYTPTSLPAGAGVPRARRYYWRVRACAHDTCGQWSPVRYVVVGVRSGSLNTDLNGDGYEDAVVAAPFSSGRAELAGTAYVYLGGDPPSSTPALVLEHDKPFEIFGASAAMVGDVNGDGFGDYLVRTLGDESTLGVAPAAHAYIYFGGATLRAQPDVVLDCPSVDDENGAVAGIGDVNGDGYDDVAIGGSYVDEQHHAFGQARVEVHFGGPAMTNAPDLTVEGGDPPTFFGSSVAAAGDLNMDGYPDFVVGAHGRQTAHIFFGGPGLNVVPDVTLHPPLGGQGGDLFGFAVAGIGDVNGDGVADLGVGAPATDAYPGPLGAVYLYFGGTSLGGEPNVSIVGKNQGDWFGKAIVGAGDVNGDGLDDIAILTPGAASLHPLPASSPDNNEHVDVFLGGAPADSAARFTLNAGPATNHQRGLAARDLDGDSRPDLLVGRWATVPPQSSSTIGGEGAVDVLLGVHGYTAPAVTWRATTTSDEFGSVLGR